MAWPGDGGVDGEEDEDASLIDSAAVEQPSRRRRGQRRREEGENEERIDEDDDDDGAHRRPQAEDIDDEGVDDADGDPFPRPRPPLTTERHQPSAAPSTSSATAAGAVSGSTAAGATQSNAQIALLYLTHKLGDEVGKERGVHFSKQLLSCVRDLVAGYAQTVGRDVELFAKHAKRSVVNVDDVLLVARRNESLTRALKAFKQREGIGKKKTHQQGRKRKAVQGSGDEEEHKDAKHAVDAHPASRGAAAAAAGIGGGGGGGGGGWGRPRG